jgi:hypothetical protein
MADGNIHVIGLVYESETEAHSYPNVAQLIKSYGSRLSCSVINCSHYNNLTNKRPAWTASENAEKVGEIDQNLIAKDTKRTQLDQRGGRCSTMRELHRVADSDRDQTVFDLQESGEHILAIGSDLIVTSRAHSPQERGVFHPEDRAHG